MAHGILPGPVPNGLPLGVLNDDVDHGLWKFSYPAIVWPVLGVQVAPSLQIGEFDGAFGEKVGAKGARSTVWL